MAKKKVTRKAMEETASGKARVELRFDQDVFDGIRKLAESAEISVNQLLHGMARWAVDNGKPGEPVLQRGSKEPGLFTEVRPQPGVVYFGQPWVRWESDEEKRQLEKEYGGKAGAFRAEGKFYFMLDFTVRRVVRED